MSIRAMEVVGDTLYAVAGQNVYQVNSALETTQIGQIDTAYLSEGPVYIESNASQVGFFDAVGAWVWEEGAWLGIDLPYVGDVGMPASQDTLTMLSQPSTYNIWQSNPNDLTTWDALNFTTEDGDSDWITGMVAIHDQLIVFKQWSTSFYVNEGNLGFTYGRLPGIYPAIGCMVQASIAVIAEQVLFLGQQQGAGPKVYAIGSYEPQAVSTYAIENRMAEYPPEVVAAAYGFAYEQAGHTFYVLTFPWAGGGETWVLDLKETGRLGKPVWHQRAGFWGGRFLQYDGTCAVQFGGVVYMGSAGSNNIWKLDLDNFQDDGQTRKILRSWRSIAEPTMATEKVNWLDIKCQTGKGVPQGTNPQLMLRQSFDDGASWSAERWKAIGMAGQTMQDIRFNRLGATKRGLNSDRIFELSSTDPYFPAFIGAEVG